jgi:hypothetical protein
VNTATPLERPKAPEGRQFLTDEEVAELRKRADRIFKNFDSDFSAGTASSWLRLRTSRGRTGTRAGTRSTENSVGMFEREFDNRISLGGGSR